MNWVIYALKDPRDGAVRYVGVTSQGAMVRFQQHLAIAISGREKTLKSKWICVLAKAGLRPTIETVEVGSGDGQGAAERRWIAHYRANGAALVNGTDGGGGIVLNRTSTPEERTAIAKKRWIHRTPEQRAAIMKKAAAGRTPEQRSASAAKMNAAQTFEQRSARNKKRLAAMSAEDLSARARNMNAAQTLESRAAQAAALRKVWAAKTPEERSAIAAKRIAATTPEQRRASARGRGTGPRGPNLLTSGELNVTSKLTNKQVLEIRDRWKRGGETQQAIADEFGVIQNLISKIVLRRTWKHI